MRLSIILALLSSTIIATGQRSMAPSSAGGGLRGKILDGTNNTPVEFTNIALYKFKDSSLVSAVSSTADGTFKFDFVPQGMYKMKVTFVGYKTNKIDSVKVVGFRPTDIGTVNIFPNSTELDEVVVKGERNVIESRIDRKIFYVDKNITAISGNATDVLQQVPSVQVDADGNVSLRGSENVNLMINGKPTMIDKNILLQQIPANTIEKIEVITNPSAKYDPEGTSGIINIVLKQGASQGTNAVVNVSAGTGDKYNGSVNLNYNPGKLNLFATYSYRKDNRNMTGWSKQNYLYNNSIHNTENDGVHKRLSHMGKLGFDYNLNEKYSFGVSGSVNKGTHSETETNKYEDIDTISKLWLRETGDNKEENFSKEAEAFFLTKFNKEGHELKIDYTFDSETEDENDTYTDKWQSDMSVFNRELQNTNGSHKTNIIQADYTLPFGNSAKLELGAKSIFRKTEDDIKYQYLNMVSNTYLNDTNKTNDFFINEDIHAVYGTYSFELGKFSSMVGLRLESALNDFKLATETDYHHNNYTSFFPSLHTSYKFNDIHEVTLSYSRRVNRPRGHMLNPFPDYSDPKNLRVGNPDLKPEYINSFEVGYNFKIEKITFQPTVFYRLTENKFDRLTIVDTVKQITIVTSQNSNSISSYGMDFGATYSPFKFWNLNASISAFQMELDATNLNNTQKSSFGYNGKIMSNMFLPMGFAFQVSAFYRSPFITPQGKSDPFYAVNAGLKKDFLKGKLTGTISVNDIFKTMHFGMKIDTKDQVGTMYHRWQSQTIFVGLTYKFGKNNKNGKKKPNENGNGNDENSSEDMMY
jgi:outer membrane receptor protein involved in Fe transport